MPESIRLMNAWFRTRMLRAPLILLSVLFALRGEQTLRVFAASFLSFAFLRFLDDAFDREHDRDAHPDRVLPKAKSGQLVLAGALLLAFAQGALFRCGAFLPLTFALFVVLALVFYSVRGLSAAPRSLFWRHLVLLKYPAVAVMLLDEKISFLLLLFGVCGLYEILHDKPTQRRWRWLIIDSSLILFSALALIR